MDFCLSLPLDDDIAAVLPPVLLLLLLPVAPVVGGRTGVETLVC